MLSPPPPPQLPRLLEYRCFTLWTVDYVIDGAGDDHDQQHTKTCTSCLGALARINKCLQVAKVSAAVSLAWVSQRMDFVFKYSVKFRYGTSQCSSSYATPPLLTSCSLRSSCFVHGNKLEVVQHMALQTLTRCLKNRTCFAIGKSLPRGMVSLRTS